MSKGESREDKKGTSERSSSVHAVRAAGPCEDASLTVRHTRCGRTPFLDAATNLFSIDSALSIFHRLATHSTYTLWRLTPNSAIDLH